jgi:ArsR family transcriptional regulator, arsenate/arsenite/antimonite-responsive transcriptional repressor
MFIYKRCSCVNKATLNKSIQATSSSLTDLLKLIAVPTRLEILLLLDEKSHCVCDIEAHTKLSQSLTSHHLSDLTDADLITSYKQGKFVHYKLTGKGQDLVKNLKTINI